MDAFFSPGLPNQLHRLRTLLSSLFSASSVSIFNIFDRR